MRWGLVARGEARGLGNLTAEAYRNLCPDRTMLIDMGHLARGFPVVHHYPDALAVPFEGGMLDGDACRWFLRRLDVVLLFETAYDWRFIEWAREEGCATVLMSMPEFWSASYPHPTVMWNPTCWRHETLPAGSKIVPVPVALDRFPASIGPVADGPLRVLHVAGHRAAHDRNGTSALLMALRRVTRPMVVTLRGQDGHMSSTRVPKHVELRLAPDSMPGYWDLYADQDVMVMPRRYGGLCLPVQEALGAGLPVVMPDCPPNPATWPIIPLVSHPHGSFRCAAGDLPMVAASAPELADTLDRLAGDRDELARHAGLARGWATDHSWDALRPLWLGELASAAIAGRRVA